MNEAEPEERKKRANVPLTKVARGFNTRTPTMHRHNSRACHSIGQRSGARRIVFGRSA
jgi:hypothetical protein